MKGDDKMQCRKKEKKSGKKKKWVLPVSIIGGVLLLCMVGVGVCLLRHCSGTYIRTNNGRHMVVFDTIGPVVLSTEDKPGRFDEIETGDMEDIPQKDREELVELGWLSEHTDSLGENDEGFPDWGLTLSVKDVTPTGLTLVCTQKGGNPTGELTCGTDYHLIVLEDGVWKDVPTVIEEYAWNSLAYHFPEGQDTEFDYTWEWLYGTLPAGTYRLTKGFMDFRETGDYDTAVYWVEFEITE